MRKPDPSDISREQFKKIEPLLISAKKITRPRKHDLYEIFCGVLYLLKSGCQWRMIPSDFPDWRSIYAYFRIRSYKDEGSKSLLEEILKKKHLPFALSFYSRFGRYSFIFTRVELHKAFSPNNKLSFPSRPFEMLQFPCDC